MPLSNWTSEQIAWICVGFLGQAMFTSRFLVQWIASERKGESVLPISFWYLSLAGGTILLVYAISRVDPVIILGQALGVVVYFRNLVLIFRKKNSVPGEETVSEREEAVVLTVPDSTSSASLRRVG